LSEYNKRDLLINKFPALKYRTQIKQSLLLKKGDTNYEITEYDRGFVPFNLAFDSTNYIRKNKLFVPIETKQLIQFDLLIKLLETNNVHVILVMTPEFGLQSKDYEQSKSMQVIESIAKTYKIPFLNFNTKLRSSFNENRSYFCDWGHMNKKGSIIFSIRLTHELQKIIHDTISFEKDMNHSFYKK
jgi:hypothetical protein